MTTYDFSMKYVYVLFGIEWEVFKKKYVKGVPSRGEGGGSATWDGGPNMGVFFKWAFPYQSVIFSLKDP